MPVDDETGTPSANRSIDGSPPSLGAPGGSAYIDIPDQATILGAAKLSGKAGDWSIGLLEAVTSND